MYMCVCTFNTYINVCCTWQYLPSPLRMQSAQNCARINIHIQVHMSLSANNASRLKGVTFIRFCILSDLMGVMIFIRRVVGSMCILVQNGRLGFLGNPHGNRATGQRQAFGLVPQASHPLSS